MSRLLYRGTKSDDSTLTRFKQLSFTPSLGAALIYSAVPGDPFATTKALEVAHFVPGSTVHAAHVEDTPTLVISEGLTTSMGDVLRLLRYGQPEGMTVKEALRVFNYMHNRLMGTAPGDPFKFIVYDESGDEMEDADVPFSIRNPQSLISMQREDFKYDGGDLMYADAVVADAFIFADAPAVALVASRLGYRALCYGDVFGGGQYAVDELFGPEFDVNDLDGIDAQMDVEGSYLPSHDTIRPLAGAVIQYVWSRPSAEVVPEIEAELRAGV